jgi:hypothetical protein
MTVCSKDVEIEFVHVGRVHSTDIELSLCKDVYHKSRNCVGRNQEVLEACFDETNSQFRFCSPSKFGAPRTRSEVAETVLSHDRGQDPTEDSFNFESRRSPFSTDQQTASVSMPHMAQPIESTLIRTRNVPRTHVMARPLAVER